MTDEIRGFDELLSALKSLDPVRESRARQALHSGGVINEADSIRLASALNELRYLAKKIDAYERSTKKRSGA
jgi:hypothetical protein